MPAGARWPERCRAGPGWAIRVCFSFRRRAAVRRCGGEVDRARRGGAGRGQARAARPSGGRMCSIGGPGRSTVQGGPRIAASPVRRRAGSRVIIALGPGANARPAPPRIALAELSPPLGPGPRRPRGPEAARRFSESNRQTSHSSSRGVGGARVATRVEPRPAKGRVHTGEQATTVSPLAGGQVT